MSVSEILAVAENSFIMCRYFFKLLYSIFIVFMMRSSHQSAACTFVCLLFASYVECFDRLAT
jgi:hypothetical protein